MLIAVFFGVKTEDWGSLFNYTGHSLVTRKIESHINIELTRAIMYFGWDCFPDGKLPFELAQENQKRKRGKELLYWSAEVSKLRGGTAFLAESFPSRSRKKTKKK